MSRRARAEGLGERILEMRVFCGFGEAATRGEKLTSREEKILRLAFLPGVRDIEGSRRKALQECRLWTFFFLPCNTTPVDTSE